MQNAQCIYAYQYWNKNLKMQRVKKKGNVTFLILLEKHYSEYILIPNFLY